MSARPSLTSLPAPIYRDIPRFVETALLFCLSLLAPLAVLPGAPSFLPAPLCLFAGLSLITFLPGYWLALLLFPRHSPVSIYWLAAISLVASFALLVLDGLLLDLLRLPLTGSMLIALQSAWALGFLIFILLRSDHVSPQSFLSHRLLSAWRASSPLVRVASLLCALLFILFAGTLASSLFAPSPESFTELYLTAPAEVSASSPMNLSITVVSHEKTPRLYSLVVTAPASQSQIPIRILPGEAHTERISLPLHPGSSPRLLQAALYLPGSPLPYRQVHLWLDAGSPP